MSSARTFYKRLEATERTHWKDVGEHKVYTPAIARGDASFVYLAVHENERVAVKTYSSQWMFDNEKILGNEIDSMNKLARLGLVPNLLRKPLQTRNNIYLVMELCNCGSLDMHFQRKIGMPVERIREVTQFLGFALLQMKSISLLHREINPRHILVHCDKNGQIGYKLTGLQFCKDIAKDPARSFVGTPEYISPQAALEAEYAHEADVWSMGVTLYELAVGATTLQVDHDFRVHVKNGKQPVFPPKRPIDPALRDLICRCLIYNPKDRITIEQIVEHPFLTGAKFVPPPEPNPISNPVTNPVAGPASNQGSKPIVKPNSKPDANPGSKPGPKSGPKPGFKQPVPGIKPVPLKSQPETKAEFALLSRKELQRIVQTNFVKYMEYVNAIEDHEIKLKCERRTMLLPYILKSQEPISKGGFGAIYRCRHEKTGEEYALKVVATSKMTDVKIASLLLGEVIIMLELNMDFENICPFAIRLVDYFVYSNEHNTKNDLPYKNDLCLVLEYCNGGDLDDYIRKLRRTSTRFPLEELKLIAWNSACGLNEMHRRKMMHRDIKAKNILVVEDPRSSELIDIKLCDYGLSKKVAEHQELNGSTILGTLDYFAPELYEMMTKRMAGEVSDVSYSSKVDVWSYGVLLYFSLYGKTIMEYPNTKHGVMTQRKIVYPPLAGVPESYMDLVRRALTHDPNKRPSFPELLTHPFFTVVVVQPRIKLYPYVQDKLLAVGATAKTKIYQCKKGLSLYAMKVIESTVASKKRLASEIDTLTKLKNNPNIIKLHDYFAMNSMIYLIFDYYNGGNLEAYIADKEKAKQSVPKEDKIFVAYCVLNGIKDVHSHNIIHRDIHPSNVLLAIGHDGRVRNAALGDFGCARILLDDSAQTAIFTPYNSPEMVLPDLGGTHDSKTDIWSFGMLVYFVVFGMHADSHAGNRNLGNVLKKGDVKYDEARAKEQPELIELMKRCLKVNPKDRPTAPELLMSPMFSKYLSKAH